MLDPSTAMVKTTKDLQRQQTFSYNLTIGASDHGRPSFSATVGLVSARFTLKFKTYMLPTF